MDLFDQYYSSETLSPSVRAFSVALIWDLKQPNLYLNRL